MNTRRNPAVSRRQLATGVAWAVPAVALAGTTPAFAASTEPPVLSSLLWFSGRGVTTDYSSTCSVPEMTSSSGACGTPTDYYPWRTRFQFYGTDDTIRYSSGGYTYSCTRDSSIAITNLTVNDLTGPITLRFWRPEHPDYGSTYDIRTWYRGANDSSKWTLPVRTSTPPQTPFGGTWAGLRMYEYETTLSLAAAKAYFTPTATGISLDLRKATAALSFYSDCMPFDYTWTQAELDAFARLGRYVLTVPTTKGVLTKDTGFYTS